MIFDYLRRALGLNRLYFGGGSGGSSATQQFTPPAWTTNWESIGPEGGGNGPWQGYLQRAIELTGKPYTAYPGQTIAGIDPMQQAGMDLTAQTAINSSQDVLAGRDNITRTAGGDYLNSNPWLNNDYTNAVINQNAQNMAQAHRLGTAAQTDAQMARSGAFGGSAYNQLTAANSGALANSVGQMANQYQLARTGMGAQDYSTERGRMMDASGFAPQLQQMDFQAGQALTGVGDINRSYLQDLYNQGQASWNQQQLWPMQQLDVYGNALARSSGNVAGGSTITNSGGYQASPFASLLGLGAAGYGLYNMAGG